MTKPVILAVDDDAAVLRAIERDLRAHYQAEYRVISSSSRAASSPSDGELEEITRYSAW